MKLFKSFKKFFIFSLFSSIIFLIIYFFKRAFFPSEIIYFEGIKIAVIAATLFTLIYKYRERKINFFIYFFLSFLINYSFIATFPVLIDRSITNFLLYKIESNEKFSTYEEINSFYLNEYSSDGMYQVDKRLKEQIEMGYVQIEDEYDSYKLTLKGKYYLKFLRTIKKVFNIQTKNLN